jgi:hypothetical protein
VWEVFEGYKIRGTGDDVYIGAVGGIKRVYRPLADEPYLFLDLARLGEAQLNLEGLNGWLDKYGVLGVHYGGDTDAVNPPLMYDTAGGPAETALYLAYASQEANRALSCYEAALNRDEDNLQRLVGGPRTAQILWECGM